MQLPIPHAKAKRYIQIPACEVNATLSVLLYSRLETSTESRSGCRYALYTFRYKTEVTFVHLAVCQAMLLAGPKQCLGPDSLAEPVNRDGAGSSIVGLEAPRTSHGEAPGSSNLQLEGQSDRDLEAEEEAARLRAERQASRLKAEREAAAARSRHTALPKVKRQSPSGNGSVSDRRKPAAGNQPFTGF